jgi:uncharacterized membrane protein (UPF0127 family)
MSKKIISILFFLIAFVFSCNGGFPEGPVEIKINSVSIMVEIASSPEEQQQGLMFRDSLDEYSGMIFVYDQEQQMSFWMKNTLIPLSIAFISEEGIINEIHDMQPLDLTSTRARYPAKYALEVNQGFFQRNGIQVGDKVELPF